MQRPKCVAVDFDNTLAYFKGGYGNSFFPIFVQRGVPEDEVKGYYQTTKEELTFSIKNMIFVVERETGLSLDHGEIVGEFRVWLADSLVAYADSVRELAEWRQEDIRVVILTTGNPEFQKQKIQASGIPYDELLVVTQDGEKPGKVRELLKRYGPPNGPPIWLVEDDPSVLDLVREAGLSESDVVTVRLMRRESPHFLKVSKHSHVACDTLEAVRRLWSEGQ